MESALDLANRGVEPELNKKLALSHLTRAIQNVCGIDSDKEKVSFSDLVESATVNNKGRRDSAIYLVRALSIGGFLPFEKDHQLERKVVALIEEGFGDQCKAIKLSEKRQTFEKLNALKGLHESICSNLRILTNLPSTLPEIVGLREDIQRALRHGPCNAYLQPFDWTNLKGKITTICDQVTDLLACKDASFKARFDRISFECSDLTRTTEATPTFIHKDFAAPFVAAIVRGLRALQEGAVGQFSCSIEPRRKPPHAAEKRYPLHQSDKLLTITIPLVNNGPGVAVDTVIEIDCGKSNSLAIESNEIRLGDIPPGEFAASFKAMVVEPATTVDMAAQVSWNQLFGNPQSIAFDVRLTAQDHSVDWANLERLDPYSLEVAEGSKFVGRAAKVQAIGNRLLKAQMSSTYITGQKRIGKTSLAQAVLRYVTAHAPQPTSYETFYLEWGEYCAADAAGTVRALGEQIFAFLRQHLPPTIETPVPNFDGSLAPLNLVVKLLESNRPEKRFVIVLDEFDEIHPEMYRYGPLAEAFFANLRTLGARKNLAFILVGGEKMPFIISAQGDQLNKFGREPLDYFSRSDEWLDYVELVTGPVKDSLNWEDSALNELFSLTNGHPYYTKLLCAKVFAVSVAQRDTEILASDIRHALNSGVAELDTNAFAHFWKDGINADREEAEVIELKRQRVLVAFGRALRSTEQTRITIAQQATGSALPATEVGPIIDDFCRRDIMKEVDDKIVMPLPIFERWIREVGVSKLIASTLADDLEDALQKANDTAYVKASEIETLVKEWPLYRGREVTGESVRAWLDQVQSAQDQRLLFTILKHLRFVTTPQIGELLENAHDRIVIRGLPPRLRQYKNEKRRDIIVSYLDGPGKSGAAYARIYAKEVGLLMECVVEPGKIEKRVSSEKEPCQAVVVIDDLAGTGRSIAEALEQFEKEAGASLLKRGIPTFLIVLFATEDAEQSIQAVARRFTESGLRINIHVCQSLGVNDRAFPVENPGFWPDEQTRDRAKALCVRLGTGLYKEPLGFGSKALLIAFPDTCPNNNLPIIFGSRSGPQKWSALLQRPPS